MNVLKAVASSAADTFSHDGNLRFFARTSSLARSLGEVRGERTGGEKGGRFTLRMQICGSDLISDCELGNYNSEGIEEGRGGISWIGGDER